MNDMYVYIDISMYVHSVNYVMVQTMCKVKMSCIVKPQSSIFLNAVLRIQDTLQFQTYFSIFIFCVTDITVLFGSHCYYESNCQG